tara:strand:- start:207 stop:767 length:561 start_codon:yes stop_codon:yes gene_type:complete
MPLGATRFGLLGEVDPGKLTLLETKTISSALANFTSLDVSTYNVHLFTMSDLVVTTQTEFGIRVSDDGGSNYETSNYEFANQRGFASGSFAERKSQSQGSMRLGGDVTTDTNSVFNGYFYMYNAGDSSKFTFFSSHNTFLSGSTYGFEFGSGAYKVASTINAIQIGEGILSAFSSGTISAYGIKDS